MKKYILIFAFILICHQAFGYENLYTFQNANKENIKSFVETALNNSNYTINKKDPYYAVSQKDNADNITVILQKSGNDVLYYYNSSKNKKADKNILKSAKNSGISYYTTDDSNYLDAFNRQAQNISSNTTKTYDFDVWNYTEPAVAINKEDDSVLKGSIVQVEKGTVFNVYLQTPINTANAKAGDGVSAVLTQDLIYQNHKIAPQGSILSGVLTKAHGAQYGSRNGRVVINFDTLTTPDNKSYKLSTEAIDFSVTNEGKLSKSAKNVATGAIIGALGGLIVGAIAHDASIGKSVLIGTAAGATSGVVTAVAERGVDAEIPVYTELEVKLTKPFRAVFY